MSSWNTKLEAKRLNAKKRKIDFSLTKEQYMNLHKNSTVCDYTGIDFDNGVHSKSIERIDDKDGYHVHNCCVVSARVNVLKDAFVDKMHKCSLSPSEFELLDKIKYTLENNTREQLTAKYREVTISNIIKEKTIMSYSDNQQVNADINLARGYIKFSEGKEDFNLSLLAFKKLSTRKTCSITGKTFVNNNNSDLARRTICMVDPTLGWADTNVYSICQLAYIIKTYNNFNSKELIKLSDSV